MRQPLLRTPSYFLMFSVFAVLVAVIGFGKTFFVPMTKGTFEAPLEVHVHGAFAFAWIFLVVAQSFLIHLRLIRHHRILGYFGLLIATGVMVTMIPAGLFGVSRDLKSGLGESAYSGILGVVTSGLLFLALVVAGVITRKRPEYHKRFMLLATIVVLWPAWFRFRHYFPAVPHPEIWFALVLADSVIVVSWIREKVKFNRVHPVLLYGGIFIIIEQIFELVTFDNPLWRSIAKSIYLSLVS